MERNPQNANLPALYRDGIFRNTSIVLEPKQVQLARVTNSPSLTSQSYTFGFSDVGYVGIYPYQILLQSLTKRAYTAITNLGSFYITVGPWATTDGQNGWVLISGLFNLGTSSYTANLNNWSANINPFNYPSTSGQLTNFITPTVNVTLIPTVPLPTISQPFFEIGTNVFDSSMASLYGSGVMYQGDVRALTPLGATLVEKSYNSNTQFKVYDFSQAQYKNCSIDSVASSLSFKRAVVFSSSGSFAKASYPEAKAVRVICVGGGGGSGAVRATSTNQAATVSGGGAGGATVGWYDITTLSSSCSVVVGSAGTAGAVPSSNGSAGGTSSFTASTAPHDVLEASGGFGSSSTAVATPPTASAITQGGGSSVVGKRCLKVEYFTKQNNLETGAASFALSSTIAIAGGGGGHYLGKTGQAGYSAGSSVGGDGMVYYPGELSITTGYSSAYYGGGGGGQVNPASRSALAGRAGQPGVVVVEIYG